jgi:hypothetical protein
LGLVIGPGLGREGAVRDRHQIPVSLRALRMGLSRSSTRSRHGQVQVVESVQVPGPFCLGWCMSQMGPAPSRWRGLPDRLAGPWPGAWSDSAYESWTYLRLIMCGMLTRSDYGQVQGRDPGWRGGVPRSRSRLVPVRFRTLSRGHDRIDSAIYLPRQPTYHTT